MAVSYTAVVLDRTSHDSLLPLAPPGWDTSKTCHHVTLNMGPWKGDPALLGQSVDIVVNGFASDDRVAAVGVTLPPGLKTAGPPHITVAVGPGGKPMMAKSLDYSRAAAVPGMPRRLRGVVKEVGEGDYSLVERLIRTYVRSVLSESAASPTRIAVFDFDGTLFASPDRPPGWTLEGWWGRPESLSPPVVPEFPEDEWWSAEVVAAARSAIADPACFTALLTGRPRKLAPRVMDLLSTAGLKFDEHFFAHGGGGTLSFKLSVLEGLITSHPSAEVVEMWEDRSEHIPHFEEKIRELGVEPIVHPVDRFLRTV